MNFKRLSLKIATPIIIAGLFIMVSFIALSYNTLTPNFYIVFAFLVVYVFLFGFAIGQNLTLPVRKLLKRADNLSKGDLKSRFYSESKDELGQLSDVFNRIADQLEESTNQNEQTKRSVGIKVEAETQALQETINALEQKVQNRTLEIQKMLGDLEKFKKNSQVKETESIELKNQLSELKEKLGKRGGKENKPQPQPKKEEKEQPPQAPNSENLVI